MSAIVLAYGDEPWVERCITSLLTSRGVEVQAVVVDNGCTTGAVDRLDGTDGVVVVRPGRNLGFAGGCNAGAAHAGGDVLVLVNADAYVRPDTLARLAAAAQHPGVGAVSASIRLADDPQRLNSAGNPISYVGLSWSGGFGEAASQHAIMREVAGASGAGLAIRRQLWEELGGFEPLYFAYHEDAELSWRCWQRGLRVLYVPDAVVVHRYEFSRNPLKYRLVERNRLLFVLTLFERRTLLLIAPALVAVEAAMLAVGVVEGWWREKLRGYGWLLRHRRQVRARRRQLQAERRVPDRALAHLLTGRFTPANVRLPRGGGVVGRLLGAYWARIRPWL
ncbi:MAG TPA: glycosyltransferase family 2 protein [Nitriliruptorales bacterium]|nr:glycosyltransferase family 2 protein [Nitriliruptorales bacterium]